MFSNTDERGEGSSVSNLSLGNCETPFVGRHDEREQVKVKLKSGFRLVQITGGPVCGKSRLAKQILVELEDEAEDTATDLRIVHVLLRNKDAESLRIVKVKILEGFGSEMPTSYDADFRDSIAHIHKSRQERHFLVLFDDCDQMINTRDSFLDMVSSLLEFKRVMVVLTSRVRFFLPRIHCGFLCELSGLPESEAAELLSLTARNVAFDTNSLQAILTRCCGLPLLLMVVGRNLEENRDILSPQELCELWETFHFDMLTADLASDEDSIEEIIGKFVSSLDEYLKKALSVLAYFPGSFSAEGATHVGRYHKTSHAKGKALIPLHNRSVLEFDPRNKRFSVSPVIRSFVNRSLTHLRDSDSVRMRFCEFFGKLLREADGNLFHKSTDMVFGDIYDEWVNVEQTLREATLPTADLFHLNMKIVREAPEIILAMLPENAEDYYRRCLPAAEIFGTPKDIACIESCIGCAAAYSRGSGLQDAIEYLEKAESKLNPEDGYQYVKLMAHFEWNYYRQGNMEKAGRYQRMGLAVVPQGEDKRRVIRQQIGIQNHRALRLIFEGQSEDAIGILMKAIELSNEHFEHNPTVRIMLNSLGLAHSELGKADTGLKFCKSSLTARRKYASRTQRELVIPLCNVACMLSVKGKFECAMALVTEAECIRRGVSWEHLDTALTQMCKGKILRRWHRYKEAIPVLKEAYRLYENCVKTHYTLPDINMELAQCYEGLGETPIARDIYQHVLETRTRLQRNHQLNQFILKVFDNLLRLSTGGDWHAAAKEMCQFLESVIRSEETLDSERSLSYREKLHHIEAEIQQRTTTDRSVNEEQNSVNKEMASEMSQNEDSEIKLSLAISKLEHHPNNLTSTSNVSKADKPTWKYLNIDESLITSGHRQNPAIPREENLEVTESVPGIRPEEHDERESHYKHGHLGQHLDDCKYGRQQESFPLAREVTSCERNEQVKKLEFSSHESQNETVLELPLKSFLKADKEFCLRNNHSRQHCQYLANVELRNLTEKHEQRTTYDGQKLKCSISHSCGMGHVGKDCISGRLKGNAFGVHEGNETPRLRNCVGGLTVGKSRADSNDQMGTRMKVSSALKPNIGYSPQEGSDTRNHRTLTCESNMKYNFSQVDTRDQTAARLSDNVENLNANRLPNIYLPSALEEKLATNELHLSVIHHEGYTEFSISDKATNSFHGGRSSKLVSEIQDGGSLPEVGGLSLNPAPRLSNSEMCEKTNNPVLNLGEGVLTLDSMSLGQSLDQDTERCYSDGSTLKGSFELNSDSLLSDSSTLTGSLTVLGEDCSSKEY